MVLVSARVALLLLPFRGASLSLLADAELVEKQSVPAQLREISRIGTPPTPPAHTLNTAAKRTRLTPPTGKP